MRTNLVDDDSERKCSMGQTSSTSDKRRAPSQAAITRRFEALGREVDLLARNRDHQMEIASAFVSMQEAVNNAASADEFQGFERRVNLEAFNAKFGERLVERMASVCFDIARFNNEKAKHSANQKIQMQELKKFVSLVTMPKRKTTRRTKRKVATGAASAADDDEGLSEEAEEEAPEEPDKDDAEAKEEEDAAVASMKYDVQKVEIVDGPGVLVYGTVWPGLTLEKTTFPRKNKKKDKAASKVAQKTGNKKSKSASKTGKSTKGETKEKKGTNPEKKKGLEVKKPQKPPSDDPELGSDDDEDTEPDDSDKHEKPADAEEDEVNVDQVVAQVAAEEVTKRAAAAEGVDGSDDGASDKDEEDDAEEEADEDGDDDDEDAAKPAAAAAAADDSKKKASDAAPKRPMRTKKMICKPCVLMCRDSEYPPGIGFAQSMPVMEYVVPEKDVEELLKSSGEITAAAAAVEPEPSSGYVTSRIVDRVVAYLFASRDTALNARRTYVFPSRVVARMIEITDLPDLVYYVRSVVETIRDVDLCNLLYVVVPIFEPQTKHWSLVVADVKLGYCLIVDSSPNVNADFSGQHNVFQKSNGGHKFDVTNNAHRSKLSSLRESQVLVKNLEVQIKAARMLLSTFFAYTNTVSIGFRVGKSFLSWPQIVVGGLIPQEHENDSGVCMIEHIRMFVNLELWNNDKEVDMRALRKNICDLIDSSGGTVNIAPNLCDVSDISNYKFTDGGLFKSPIKMTQNEAQMLRDAVHRIHAKYSMSGSQPFVNTDTMNADKLDYSSAHWNDVLNNTYWDLELVRNEILDISEAWKQFRKDFHAEKLNPKDIVALIRRMQAGLTDLDESYEEEYGLYDLLVTQNEEFQSNKSSLSEDDRQKFDEEFKRMNAWSLELQKQMVDKKYGMRFMLALAMKEYQEKKTISIEKITYDVDDKGDAEDDKGKFIDKKFQKQLDAISNNTLIPAAEDADDDDNDESGSDENDDTSSMVARPKGKNEEAEAEELKRQVIEKAKETEEGKGGKDSGKTADARTTEDIARMAKKYAPPDSVLDPPDVLTAPQLSLKTFVPVAKSKRNHVPQPKPKQAEELEKPEAPIATPQPKKTQVELTLSALDILKSSSSKPGADTEEETSAFDVSEAFHLDLTYILPYNNMSERPKRPHVVLKPMKLQRQLPTAVPKEPLEFQKPECAFIAKDQIPEDLLYPSNSSLCIIWNGEIQDLRVETIGCSIASNCTITESHAVLYAVSRELGNNFKSKVKEEAKKQLPSATTKRRVRKLVLEDEDEEEGPSIAVSKRNLDIAKMLHVQVTQTEKTKVKHVLMTALPVLEHATDSEVASTQVLLLRQCYLAMFETCSKKEFGTIALPVMGTGTEHNFQYGSACTAAFSAISEWFQKRSSLTTIVMCVPDTANFYAMASFAGEYFKILPENAPRRIEVLEKSALASATQHGVLCVIDDAPQGADLKLLNEDATDARQKIMDDLKKKSEEAAEKAAAEAKKEAGKSSLPDAGPSKKPPEDKSKRFMAPEEGPVPEDYPKTYMEPPVKQVLGTDAPGILWPDNRRPLHTVYVWSWEATVVDIYINGVANGVQDALDPDCIIDTDAGLGEKSLAHYVSCVSKTFLEAVILLLGDTITEGKEKKPQRFVAIATLADAKNATEKGQIGGARLIRAVLYAALYMVARDWSKSMNKKTTQQIRRWIQSIQDQIIVIAFDPALRDSSMTSSLNSHFDHIKATVDKRRGRKVPWEDFVFFDANEKKPHEPKNVFKTLRSQLENSVQTIGLGGESNVFDRQDWREYVEPQLKAAQPTKESKIPEPSTSLVDKEEEGRQSLLSVCAA